MFKKSCIELFHKKTHLNLLPKMLKDKLDEIEKAKNKEQTI